MTFGFLLMVSLVVSAALKALGTWVNGVMPSFHLILQALGFLISLLIIAVLFGAVYKVLPDKKLAWRDVAVGAISTAILFTIGKFLISLYIGSSAVASSYGAAGALIVILIWIYYSAQIFLLGAEFTKAYATTHGSQRTDADASPRDRPAQTRAGCGLTGGHGRAVVSQKVTLAQFARDRVDRNAHVLYLSGQLLL